MSITGFKTLMKARGGGSKPARHGFGARSGNWGRGSMTIWAWLLSGCVHIILFVVLALVRFSGVSVPEFQSTATTVNIDQIKKLMEMPRIIPKPKIKKLSSPLHGRVEKVAMDFLFRPDVKPFRKSQDQTKISDVDTIDLLAESGFSFGRTGFFGSFTDERKICYVVDCSGSMQGLFGQVRKQLKSSIAALRPDQYFYIIFFQGDKLLEFGDGHLVRARPEAKLAAYRFADGISPGGPTNALKALERAMGIRGRSGDSPGLIYFLTDGFDLEIDDTARFSLQLENMRKRLAPSVKINTIGFWTEQADGWILQKVAEQSGGEHINIE